MTSPPNFPWLPPDATLQYSLTIPKASPSNNILKNSHFFTYKKLRQTYKSLITESLHTQHPTTLLSSIPPLTHAFLHIIRGTSSTGLDWDNAYGGLKPLIDCLVAPSPSNPSGLGLILNDNPTNLPYPPFLQQHTTKQKNAFTQINIYSLPPCTPSPWLPTDATLQYSLTIPKASPSNNVIKDSHFFAYKKLRQTYKSLLTETLRTQYPATLPPPPLSHAFLHITRGTSSTGLDWDNAYGGLKPLIDCLVAPSPANPSGLGLILNDNPTNLPYPPFLQQQTTKQKDSFTRINIYRLGDLNNEPL